MSLCYDIYALSTHRNQETIEKFLHYYTNRPGIEDREGEEIMVYSNEKYGVQEISIPVHTMTDVLAFGIKNENKGFYFYVSDHLLAGVRFVILKFTYDNKLIFGISVDESRVEDNGRIVDNYDRALKIQSELVELTQATKTSIMYEYAPADDEEEFDADIEQWKTMNKEKIDSSCKSK